MDKREVMQRLARTGVAPVVRADSAAAALGAVRALVRGGIPVAEVTMTTPDAVEVIRQLASEGSPDLLVGVGTVTDTDQCRAALDAGARFVVTPASVLDVVSACRERDVAVICGGLTPTEILAVWKAGADAVKVFPAAAMGGAAYLKMLREPLPGVPLVPTGGVNLDTLEDYFRAGALFVGAGGDLVSREAARKGDFERIAERARLYAAAVDRLRPGAP